ALEHNAAAIDEHQIGENVLHFFDLVRRNDDGAAAIEIVVQQRIVKLLPKQNVQAKRWLIEHEQARVHCHHDRKMQLRDHSLGYFFYSARAFERRSCQKVFGLGAIESRVHASDIIEQL